MAQSLKNYQQNLTENQKKLFEIGELQKPYFDWFHFDKDGQQISTTFKDHEGNNINVYFHPMGVKTPSYEVEFTVNGHSKESFITNHAHFFKIISTVMGAINQFIKEYKPYQLLVEPDEKLGKENQKSKIWIQYAKMAIKDDGFILSKSPNGFSIQINKNLR